MDANIKQVHVDGIVARFNDVWKGRDFTLDRIYIDTVRDIQTYCCHVLGSGMKYEDGSEILDGLIGWKPMPEGNSDILFSKEEAVALAKKLGADEKADDLKKAIMAKATVTAKP
jgi:hypothetical protein